MSLLLTVGTCVLALWLKQMRQRLYFTTFVRRIISDFAITIAILIMIAIDMVVGYNTGIETPKLNVPNKLRVTRVLYCISHNNIEYILADIRRSWLDCRSI
jgi:hypothetical protein